MNFLGILALTALVAGCAVQQPHLYHPLADVGECGRRYPTQATCSERPDWYDEHFCHVQQELQRDCEAGLLPDQRKETPKQVAEAPPPPVRKPIPPPPPVVRRQPNVPRMAQQ